MEGEAKCNCQRCSQPLAFPLEMDNTEIACPHCGKMTTLIIPRVRALPVPSPAAAEPPAVDLDGLVIGGYVSAVLLPIVGFIIGIILLAKNRPGSGIACIFLSIICGALAIALLSGSFE